MPEINNPYNDPELIVERSRQEDPWVMYIIVRSSLAMGVGKVAAQVGHAVGIIYSVYYDLLRTESFLKVNEWLGKEEILKKINQFEAWQGESFRKIVLKAKDSQWESLKQELDCVVVRDAGLTEIAPGETVIGIWPMKKSKCPKIIKRLQCL